MEENENLMSIFGSNGLELNLDPIPDVEDTSDVDGDELENDNNNPVDEPTEPTEEPTEEPTDDDNLDENPTEDSEEVVEEDDSEGDGTEDTSPNIYSSFASVLHEEGLLPSLELQNAKIESIEDLTSAFKGEIANQAKSFIVEKIGEDGYEALEKGVKLSELQEHRETVDILDTVQEEHLSKDLELSKKIIYEDYISQGMDARRATRLLKKTIDLGDESIVEEAVESLASLKAIQAKKLEQLAVEREKEKIAQAKQQEKIDNDLKNTIYNADELIKGMKISKAMQDRVYGGITKVVGKSPNGVAENQLMRDRRENPVEFDVKLYYLYELTKGFSDFSKLKTSAATSAITDLEKGLRQNRFQDSGNPSYMTDPESYGGIGSELNL